MCVCVCVCGARACVSCWPATYVSICLNLSTDDEVLDGVAMAMVVTGLAVFVVIMSGVKVVYGRYAPGASPLWGVPVNAKLAWVVQEIPCVIIGGSNMVTGRSECLDATVNQV